MSATLGINKLLVEKIGTKVQLPNNDLARLMYYLNCVFSVIQYDQNNKISDYKRYYNLNEEEKALVYTLAILFNPKIFISAGVFIVNPELLSDNNANEFFKITDERIGVHVNQEIMIGGRAVKVLKIMVCNSSWIERYYFSPLKNMIQEAENEENRQRNIPSYSRNTSIRNEVNPQSSRIIIVNQNRSKAIDEGYNSYNNLPRCFACGRNISPIKERIFNCSKCCCNFFMALFFCPFYILYLL